MAYTWALKEFLYPYFGVYVGTIMIFGPFGIYSTCGVCPGYLWVLGPLATAYPQGCPKEHEVDGSIEVAQGK